MLETFPQTERASPARPESSLELPDHLDVSKVMEEKNAFFVHMVQVTDAFNAAKLNRSIDTTKLSIGDKLDLLYGTNPTLSASTVRPQTSDGTFHGGFGVIFNHGEITHAAPSDNDTIAVSHKERHVIGGNRSTKEDIDGAIERIHLLSNGEKSYNELVLKNPEVNGGFMKLDTSKYPIVYEEEERQYYDGEKKVTKIGIVDFTNPVDQFGRLTGTNFDKPFSVLLEMQKRGKVFFMDEANQMYIIQNIDEANRKVEFVASPITPKDFAAHYGEERINPYTKKEFAERLEKSLQEKGMTLH